MDPSLTSPTEASSPVLVCVCVRACVHARVQEIVVDSVPWVENLPHSVEAIFKIDCNDGDAQLHYGAADGQATANSCADARRAADAMHKKFLSEYGMSAADFPLLTLRPDNWEAPFAA